MPREIQKKTRRSSFTKRASLPLFLVIGIGLLVLFSISFFKEALRSWEIEQEISSLENDVSQLHQQNNELSQLLTKIQTTAWEEKEARTRLNLAKSGETVVLLPTQTPQPIQQEQELAPEQDTSLPNPVKWWYYFTRY